MKTQNAWDQPIVPDRLGIQGQLVARIAVPRNEFHLIAASGVEEVPASAFWFSKFSDGSPRLHAGRNPYRLGNPRWEGPISSPALTDPNEMTVLYLTRPNGFINLGLHFILDRIFNINTPSTAITHMGISDDTTAVTATTLLIDPTAGSGSPDFQTLGSGVGAAATSRTGNTVTCSAGWEPGDFSTVFAVTKVGLSTASTDAGDDTVPTVNGVVNIIGGVGGSAPYNEPFTIDLTTVSDFDLTLQQQITAQAT